MNSTDGTMHCRAWTPPAPLKRQRCGLWRRLRRPSRSAWPRISPRGRPTDRPEKPEWLFGLALRAARQLAPGTAPLQGALDIHGLGSVYHLPLEFSRAIRGAVQVLARCWHRDVREHAGPHAIVQGCCKALLSSGIS